jgi:UDP-N-acetylmuramoyl-tripeptide--D-alanyl-D-alanine ligase
MKRPPAFTVQDIVRATQGALVGGDLAVPITGVSIDSRSLAVGEAFFAIKGHRLDGHAYLSEAAGRGSACLVVHDLPDEVPPNVPLVLVQDTTKSLGRLAAWHRAKFAIPVVAVTGSNGKTTTKELMAAILGTRWNTLKPAGSFNNQWGLPLTLLELGPEHGALVVELGTNQPGEIAELAALAKPTVGAVTVVAPVHTEFLGSLEGVRDEKAGLVRALAPEGVAVLNADDARVASMARDTRARVLTFGTAATADVRAVGEISDGPDGLTFTLVHGGATQRIALALSGRHNVVNALAAAGAGVALGFSLAEIATGLAAARPAKGRCVWRMAGEVRLLDDTYNANPESVRAALDTVAAHRGGARRLVVVLGDMLELGPAVEEAHREIGRYAVSPAGADVVVGMGRHARTLVEAARAAGVSEAQHTETFEDTVAFLLKELVPGDLVLVKGSRGMRMERIVDALVARLARAGQE